MAGISIVGLGPGDPELITVKGLKKLQEADIIFYPKTSLNFALNILKKLGINMAKTEPLEFPIGDKRIAELSRSYADRIQELASSGKNVAYALEGEPMLYSTFIDIMPYIDAEYYIVPGISSINGMSAAMQFALSTKDQDLLVLPALNDYEYMKEKILSSGNIIIIKPLKAKQVIKRIVLDCNIKNYFIMSNISNEYEKRYNSIDDISDYMTVVVIKRSI
ncbi:MAG: precorrin-2 C(20)-methyltransferase [Ferroplasma sp.]